MFTESEIRAFGTLGHLRVPAVLDRDATSEMQERIWRKLRHNGADPDDASTWSADKAFGLRTVRDHDPDPNAAPAFVGALDSLMGAGTWRTQDHWGQALVTFPSGEPWNVPGGPWHLDHPYWYPPDEVWGVNVFLIVDDLEPGGGGTGVVQGSPELIRRWLADKDPRKSTQKQLRRGFEAKHPYFKRLADLNDGGDRSDFTNATVIDEVSVKVIELTGEAGDVVICHPWALHNGTPNVRERPRLMRACRAYHRDLYAGMAE